MGRDEYGRDEYGQVNTTVLDEFFTYIPIPIQNVTNDKFDGSLKMYLARTIASDKKSFNEFKQAYAEYFDSQSKSYYIDQLEKLEKKDTRDFIFPFYLYCDNLGLELCSLLEPLYAFIALNDRLQIQKRDQAGFFLDRAVAMIYGDGASVGDVCQYAERLIANSTVKYNDTITVKNVPGYCCLDAPYENIEEWGEKV